MTQSQSNIDHSILFFYFSPVAKWGPSNSWVGLDCNINFLAKAPGLNRPNKELSLLIFYLLCPSDMKKLHALISAAVWAEKRRRNNYFHKLYKNNHNNQLFHATNIFFLETFPPNLVVVVVLLLYYERIVAKSKEATTMVVIAAISTTSCLCGS